MLFLNPIEECFSVCKAYLKQHLNNIAGGINAAAAARAGVPQNALSQDLLRQVTHGPRHAAAQRHTPGCG